MLNDIKKWAIQKTLTSLTGKGIAMTTIKIDRHAKTLDLQLDLEGESTPVTIHAAYTFEKNLAHDSTISLSKIQISRKWLQLAAQFAVENKKFPLPPEATQYAELLL